MKKVVLISSVLLTFVVGVYYYCYSDSPKYVLESSSNKKVIRSNSLTMMYETEYQSGEYQVSSNTIWPQDGYIFNETISKCENGNTLNWDSNTNRVMIKASTCYVYFDKIQTIVEIQNLDVTIYISEVIINNYNFSSEFDLDKFYLIVDGLGEFQGNINENGEYVFYISANPYTTYNYKIYALDKMGNTTNYKGGSFYCSGRNHYTCTQQ